MKCERIMDGHSVLCAHMFQLWRLTPSRSALSLSSSRWCGTVRVPYLGAGCMRRGVTTVYLFLFLKYAGAISLRY